MHYNEDGKCTLIAIAISGDKKKPRRYKNVADRETAFNMVGSCEYIE
jgi:hypothetical protein